MFPVFHYMLDPERIVNYFLENRIFPEREKAILCMTEKNKATKVLRKLWNYNIHRDRIAKELFIMLPLDIINSMYPEIMNYIKKGKYYLYNILDNPNPKSKVHMDRLAASMDKEEREQKMKLLWGYIMNQPSYSLNDLVWIMKELEKKCLADSIVQ